MKRYDHQRLDDIATAITAIRSHLTCGDLSDGLAFDAVRIRLLEIGEAVKAITPSLLATEPDIPWKNIAAMRDQLAHLRALRESQWWQAFLNCPGSGVSLPSWSSAFTSVDAPLGVSCCADALDTSF